MVLALGASVSVWYAHGAISAATRNVFTANASQQISTNTGANDDDGDGLTNAQEAYWRTDPNNPDTDGDGFKDGEEILTGHNPLVKGPDDWLDPSKNLTQRTVSLTLGGVLAGDLNPASAGYQQSVKMLADAIVQQYKENVAVTTDPLNIVEDTTENQHAYALAMSKVLATTLSPALSETNDFLQSIGDIDVSDPTALIKNDSRYTQFTQKADQLADSDGTRAAQIAAIPVPRIYVPQHTSAVRLLRTLQKYYLLAGQLKEDPLQGSIVISSLIQVEYQAAPQFLYDFREALAQHFSL